VTRRFVLASVLLYAITACRGATPAPDAPLPEGLSAEERRDIDVFRRASASVVFITNYTRQLDFFSFNAVETPAGTGSGFVWDKDGHIVTNYHVIENGSKFSVALGDQEYDATVVGAAPDKDIAVIKVDAPPARLSPLTVGRSRDLVVGQRVLAVGNPFGFDHTLTTGVVSGLGRELNSPSGRRIRDVIQTDAAINPGNSGGPLLDSSGRLIGINSAIYSPSGASAGISFAVPIDTVSRLVPQLIRYGRLKQPGIAGATFVSDSIARANNIEGVAIYQVEDGSPGDTAGLSGIRVSRRGRPQLGDVIVAVDGKRVRTQQDLFDLFEAAGVGTAVRLTVADGGTDKRRDVRLTLYDLR
jgi:S1-C subfamily serine protease